MTRAMDYENCILQYKFDCNINNAGTLFIFERPQPAEAESNSV